MLAQHIWLTPTLATISHEEVGAGGEEASKEETSSREVEGALPAPEVILAESSTEVEDVEVECLEHKVESMVPIKRETT